MGAKRVPVKQALKRCSWCGKKIRKNTPVYGLGGRQRHGVDLTEYEASAILISLVTTPKDVIYLVAAPDSPAEADGKDFMLCFEECADQMKAAMDAEVALGNALFGSLKRMRD